MAKKLFFLENYVHIGTLIIDLLHRRLNQEVSLHDYFYQRKNLETLQRFWLQELVNFEAEYGDQIPR